jgi:hypothetical protein
MVTKNKAILVLYYFIMRNFVQFVVKNSVGLILLMPLPSLMQGYGQPHLGGAQQTPPISTSEDMT